MLKSTTILTELNSYIKQHEFTIRQFALKLGINVGTVSHILNGTRKLTVNQLDRITEVMGFPRGHYYAEFIREYLEENNPDWRRIRPLLFNCVELDKLDCITETVNLLLENLMYSPLLFDVAEELFQSKKYSAAEILYENVADSERKQHSERLALCQYRLFTIRIGQDQMQNFKTACQFEPFADRLDEILQLDALKDLANMYRSLRLWDRVEIFAREMEHKAKILYFTEEHSKNSFFLEQQNKLSRPLFVYIAYAKLLYANVSEGKGDYEHALQYTYEYADLNWVKETDDNTKYWMNLFLAWAQANIFANKLMSGDLSILSDYISYIEMRSDEVFTALINILYAANRYQFNVDSILQRFEIKIKTFEPQSKDMYSGQVIPDSCAKFFYELAFYYLRKCDYRNGFKNIMQGLEYSIKINKESMILKFVGLFEDFSNEASIEVRALYKNLIKKVCAVL
nr:helix-turn-helix transcriptional regulator [Fontibacillus phaseoli]